MNRALIAVSGATAAVLGTLVFFAATGALNPRSFAVACLVVTGASAVGWFLALRRVGATGTVTRFDRFIGVEATVASFSRGFKPVFG
jgi:hypothetical protein